jgi:HEPN domain-containing protein
MPPDPTLAELVSDWLAKAEEDFGLCEHLVDEGVFPNAIGFHAQQAAEKYLKAFLVSRQADFPKTHDLGLLVELLRDVSPELADSLPDLDLLTPYGVEVRYPGDRVPLSSEEARHAFGLARAVRQRVTEEVGKTHGVGS